MPLALLTVREVCRVHDQVSCCFLLQTARQHFPPSGSEMTASVGMQIPPSLYTYPPSMLITFVPSSLHTVRESRAALATLSDVQHVRSTSGSKEEASSGSQDGTLDDTPIAGGRWKGDGEG